MLSDIIKKINDEAYESNEESFVTINVRPNEKILGMLDVIAFLEGKNPASSMSKQFSQKLAELLMSSKDNQEIIESIINNKIKATGATKILNDLDVIQLNFDFEFDNN